MRGGVASLGATVTEVIDEKWVPRRYLVLAAAAAIFAFVWLYLSGASGGDWSRGLGAARSFNTVPANGDVVAPVTLVLGYPFTFIGASTGWIICSALCMVLGLLTIWCVEQTAEVAGLGSRRVRERAVLFGGLFLMYAWALPGARWGHPDDVVALLCVAVAGRGVVSQRWLVAAVMIAVAIDAKPWAALVLPLAAACSGKRLRGLVVAMICAGLPWLPFYLLQHGHVASLNLPVTADSGLHYLGVAIGASPAWARELQLAVALPLGAYAVAKQKWYLVSVIAFAVRINLDPVTVPYYTTGVVFGLFAWDVMRPPRFWGGRTAMGCIALALLPSYLEGLSGYGAATPVIITLRVLAAVVPIGALFGLTSRSVRPELESLP